MQKLGEIILEAGLITSEQFDKLLAAQKKKKKRFGELVVELGFSREVDIAQALSRQLGYPFVDLTEEPIAPEAVAIIDEEMAKHDLIFPYIINDDTLTVAMADPLSFSTIDDVRFKTGFKVAPVIATASDIIKAIEKHYNIIDSLDKVVTELGATTSFEILSTSEVARDVTELKKKGEAPPIVRTVNAIIANAIKRRASDIHIEPKKRGILVRNRIDGFLQSVLELPKWVLPSVVSRVKIMAALDISEKRHPQDGRIRVKSADHEVDLRVSTLPTRMGEKVVIRLLNCQSSLTPMEEVGFSDDDYKRIGPVVNMSQGVTLVTGPTGSGKSTTLYSFLHHVKNDGINIVTLEDPIEFEVDGVNQVQTNEKAGLTFASGLRSILRQDPDVIMVGEMRDKETSEIAMRASLTGHLVFSTLHTNNAVSTVTRLVDIGIPQYLIASSLSAIVSQRLVRKICSNCTESYTPSEAELTTLSEFVEKEKVPSLHRGKGCEKCSKTGFFGRIALFEILIMNKTLRVLISSGQNEETLEAAARNSGMKLIWEDAVGKVLNGDTTLKEIERVVHRRGGLLLACDSCGRNLELEHHICPYCGHEPANRCPSCKKLIKDTWYYCPHCSSAIERKGER